MSVLSARRNVLLTALLATLSVFALLQTANAQTPWDTIPQAGFERATGFYYASPASGISLV